MPDGKTLLIGANDNAKVSLWLQPLDGAARKLDLGTVSPSSSFWVDVAVGKDGAIAFTATDPTRPAELYYMSSATATPKRLTNVNAEIAALNLGQDRSDHLEVRRVHAQRHADVSARLLSWTEVPARARHPRRPARGVARDVCGQPADHGGKGVGRVSAELSRQRSDRQRVSASDCQRCGCRTRARRDGRA